MKHKRSLEALIVGFVLTIAVSFFSTKIAGAVLAVSLIQMFLFYRCPFSKKEVNQNGKTEKP